MFFMVSTLMYKIVERMVKLYFPVQVQVKLVCRKMIKVLRSDCERCIGCTEAVSLEEESEKSSHEKLKDGSRRFWSKFHGGSMLTA